MIWFTCQQCSKKHGRPESSAGSVVFCTCGHGNTVPWESTTEPMPTVDAQQLPKVPELAPLKFAPEPAIPVLPSRPAKRTETDEPPRWRERDRERSPRRRKQRDPRFCLHHGSVASQAQCVDCRNGFCQDCLVTLQGQPLCGPCKNQRVKALHRSAPSSQLALMSLLLALFTSPLAFCLHALGRNFATSKVSVWALLPQLIALGLAIWAVRTTEKNHRLGGKSLALSAVMASSVGVCWTLLLTFYAQRLWG